MKIKLIILDLYGVISQGSYKDTCRYISKHFHIPYKHAYEIIYHKYFSAAALGKISEADSFRLAVKELNIPVDWKKIRALHYKYIIVANRQALNLAKKLQELGYEVLLLSKNIPPQFRYTVDKLKLKKFFKHIVNTHSLGLPKASKQTMLWVMKKFKVRPQEIVFADDQDFNLPEAKKLGVKTIHYKNYKQFKSELTKYLK